MEFAALELRLQSTAFDTENLRIHKLRARERMSQLFEVELEVVALAERVLDLDEVMGASAGVSIELGERSARHFHGLITHVEQLPVLQSEQTVYRMTLSPMFWQAKLVETLDIHLDTTVPRVIEFVMGRLALAVGEDYELHLADYPERELIVEYRETDLAFVSRLCEHLGIFFYFAHGDSESTMVFGDGSEANRPIAGDDAVPYHARGEQHGVYELHHERTLIPGTYVCRDYNEQTPALELQGDHGVEEGFAGGVIEYGGDFHTTAEASQLAKVRAEESLCRLETYRGHSIEPRFAPGHTFQLEGHPQHSRSLLLVEVEHEASQDVAGWGDGSEKRYQNRFTAIPAERTYRPPRVTPVPRIHGVMSGVIETHQGAIQDLAKLDDQGRYTVRFLFDTAPPGERKASCPVRMMQASAGPSYGIHFPLKPGIEVAIVFLDGNPDRPLIVGAVPNPITPTPVNAPVSTKSRIKTRSGILLEFEDSTRNT